MNKSLIVYIIAIAKMAISTCAQGTFQNLDFESARIIPPSNSNIATTNALPGWQAFIGTNQAATVPYNNSAAANQVGLVGTNNLVLSGNFSTLLSGNGSISQTGLVPVDAQLLLFKGSWTTSTPLIVSLGGQDLSYTAFSSGPNYKVYGADISSFAGQTEALSFFAPISALYVIDDIQFAVPEPSALSFGFLGIGILIVRRARRSFTSSAREFRR